MALIKSLKIQSVVILAENFNPSIFNTHWLIKNSLIQEDDISQNSSCTPMFSQLITNKYNMIVTPNNLQFRMNNPDLPLTSDIQDFLIPIVRILKETPYKAIGINFSWHVTTSDNNIDDLCNKLFYFPSSKLHNKFKSDNSIYGGYFSNNFENTRLKLKVTPMDILDESQEQKRFLEFEFNFHGVCHSEDGANELIKILQNWDKCKKEAQKIMELI